MYFPATVISLPVLDAHFAFGIGASRNGTNVANTFS
jgi:hypothetical protein